MKKVFFYKTFLKIFSIMIIPVLVLGTSFFYLIGNHIKNTLTSNNQNILKQTTQITQMLFQTFDTVNMVISSDNATAMSLYRITAENSEFSGDDLRQLNSMSNIVNSIIASNPYIYSVYIYMDHATRYYSSNDYLVPISRTADTTWMEYLNNASGSNSFASRRLYRGSYDSNREIISIYRRLYNGRGTVIVNVDIQKLRDALSEFVFYSGQQIHITDGTNTINLAGTGDLSSEMLTEILSRETDDAAVTSNHDGYLISSLPIDRYNWRLIALTPTDSLYALQKRLIIIMIFATLLCLVCGFIIAMAIARKNYRNISEIVDAIETVEHGGPVAKLPPRNSDIYTYIIRNIIQNGILRNYMKVQISEKKYMLQTLELTALQYQINPHFLVNTLKTIYWRSVESYGMGSSLSLMIENLADVTGYSLSDPNKLVTLSTEIMHTKSFCEILCERHSKEVSIEWDYPDTLLDAVCNRLIFQPYIENAFYHGIRSLEDSKKMGRIRVKIRLKDTRIIAKIIDNGMGMPKEKVAAIQKSLRSKDLPLEHIGLYNPHRRIVLTFGKNSGVRVYSKSRVGTCIEICFPYTTESPTKPKLNG